MDVQQLQLDLGEISVPRGGLRRSVELMIEALTASGRLDTDHLPMVALLRRLADGVEVSGGRGASVAMLAQQFQDVWERLATLPAPIDPDAVDEEFDVYLVPVLTDAG